MQRVGNRQPARRWTLRQSALPIRTDCRSDREEIQMGVEGIGARVARKEDKRFLTGKGRYTDDMVVPGMKYAAFVRSPHAHAKIKSIDVERGRGDAGRDRRADGKQLQGRRHRQSDLRLDDPFQGRLADEDGRLAAAGGRHGALCRRCRGDRRRRHARARRAMRPKTSRSTTRNCRRSPRRVEALKPGAPQLHPEAAGQSDLRLGDRRRRRRPMRRSPRPPMSPRSTSSTTAWSPNADGAARRARHLRRGRGPLHLLDDLAEPACGAAGDERLLQCRAGEQAARHRAGCRRRLRLEDLHLSGRDRLPLGLQEDRRAGQMDGRPHREPS